MVLPWVFLLIGLLGRVFIPWLVVRQQDPENAQWAWKYVWPQALSFVILFLMLPLLIADLEAVSQIPFQAAWLMGWGAGDIGRKSYKVLASDE